MTFLPVLILVLFLYLNAGLLYVEGANFKFEEYLGFY